MLPYEMEVELKFYFQGKGEPWKDLPWRSKAHSNLTWDCLPLVHHREQLQRGEAVGRGGSRSAGVREWGLALDHGGGSGAYMGLGGLGRRVVQGK